MKNICLDLYFVCHLTHFQMRFFFIDELHLIGKKWQKASMSLCMIVCMLSRFSLYSFCHYFPILKYGYLHSSRLSCLNCFLNSTILRLWVCENSRYYLWDNNRISVYPRPLRTSYFYSHIIENNALVSLMFGPINFQYDSR